MEGQPGEVHCLSLCDVQRLVGLDAPRNDVLIGSGILYNIGQRDLLILSHLTQQATLYCSDN